MHLSIFLLAVLPLALAAPPRKRSEPAPLITPRDSQVLPDKYIIKFKGNSDVSVLDEAINELPGDADHVYRDIFKGFSMTLDKDALSAVRDRPEVEYVEKDGISKISGFVQQKGSPWGLARISNRQPGAYRYVFDRSAGEGTCAYVIDTGVDASHPDFNGRATQLVSFIPGENSDGVGHGTHIASIIGSQTYGVAKKTQILGVKVLSDQGSGANSAIIAGMEFVARDKGGRRCPKGVVANMSLGSQYSPAMNQAAAELVRSGVFLGVAAGNDNQDASLYSPASEPSVCTVGGTAPNDTRYQMSNWGGAVKILASGVEIVSTRAGGGSVAMTGTSMATPHVVGLAAYLAALEGLNGTNALCRRIQELAGRNIISDQPQDTVNLLAFNGTP